MKRKGENRTSRLDEEILEPVFGPNYELFPPPLRRIPGDEKGEASPGPTRGAPAGDDA